MPVLVWSIHLYKNMILKSFILIYLLSMRNIQKVLSFTKKEES